MRLHPVALASCRAAFVVVPGFAERMPNDRADATHVVVGKVESVDAREDKGFHHYLVEITVEKAIKGNGLEVRPRGEIVHPGLGAKRD